MIPADFIAEWRSQTRWATDEQVEQDLVLSRVLVDIFRDSELSAALALRGGTALHKLHFAPPRRYSDDIDLVQLRPGPFGPFIDRMRRCLSWLGEPRREQGRGVRLVYRFESEIPPVVPLKLKVETDTREHFTVHGATRLPFTVTSRWWSGAAEITTFEVVEVLGTKLRALYQRRKARDLFDLALALEMGVDPAAIVQVFQACMQASGTRITRADFEENLAAKLRLRAFEEDLAIVLPPGTTFDMAAGAARVGEQLIARLPGKPWKSRATKPKRP